MKLLDTNIVVYARQPKSPFHFWASEQIANLVSTEGAAFSAASIAELCAEDGVDSASLPSELADFGLRLLDVPAGAAVRCGEAYREYRHLRRKQSGLDAPKMPLPDFFIGAHADFLGFDLVTNDPQRFRKYFPGVKLLTP